MKTAKKIGGETAQPSTSKTSGGCDSHNGDKDVSVRLPETGLEGRIKDLEAKVKESSGDIKQLVDWIEKLEICAHETFKSRRWKMGNGLGNFFNRIIRKPDGPMAEDGFRKVIGKFHEWKALRYSLPDLEKDPEAHSCPEELSFPVTREEDIPEKSVTVIVPVYNAFDHVDRCLGSLVENTDRRHTILLIDDGSTDPHVPHLLEAYAREFPNIRLIRNRINFGYTKTINLGCKSCDTDVVLLNSDTRVTSFWLEKLQDSAYRRRNIGTVTPVSNNAGAFSVPHVNRSNEIPPEYDLNAYGKLLSSMSLRCLPDVITGNGFCLYVKRRLFNDIGYFNEEAFPRGYGEENDFCMRAIHAGYSNVIDDGVFVYHHRSASFGENKKNISHKSREALKSLHPEYDQMISKFQKDHPLEYFSKVFDDLLAADSVIGKRMEDRRDTRDRRHVLFIIHDGGGGLILTTKDLIRGIDPHFKSFLLICGTDTYTLRDGESGETLYEFDLKVKWKPKAPLDKQRLSVIKYICQKINIEIVHIRSLIGTSPNVIPFLKYIGVSVVFSFHDLYCLCPTIQLLDERGDYCGATCTEGKGRCRISNRWYGPIPDLKHDYVHKWRQRMRDGLFYSDILIATTESTRKIVEDHFPELKGKKMTTIEHGRDIYVKSSKAAILQKPVIPIIAMGVSGIYKGEALLTSLIRLNVRHMKNRPDDIRFEFHILGKGDNGLKQNNPGVVYHGSYERTLLPEIVERINPSFSIIPSIIPETYCHTLTESWMLGIPVLGSDIGALRERISLHGGGWLLDQRHPGKWFDRMLEIARDETSFKIKIEEIAKMNFKTVEMMADDYVQVYKDLF